MSQTPGTAIPTRSSHRRAVKVALIAAAGVLGLAGLLVAAGLVLLRTFDVVGDEWQCSQGESPAGPQGVYSQCRRLGSTLPAGWEFDPLGNRPLSYNCDKHGWVLIERTAAATDPVHKGDDEDCLREGLPMPVGWRVARDS